MLVMEADHNFTAEGADEIEPDVPDAGDIDPPSDDDDGGSNRWVTVATFWQSTEAHIARLKLESEEIDCVLIDENLVATDWLYANAVGGIKLRVPEEDAARARQILSERPPAIALEADEIRDEADRAETILVCPECGSSRVDRPLMIRRNIWAMAAMMLMATTILIFALPVLLVVYFVWLRPYHCQACDHVWHGSSQRGFDVKQPVEE
jgi:hypothetical protein